MLFTPEHIQMIAEGRKTQTRRVCKPGDELRQWDVDTPMVYHIDDGWCGHEGPEPACYPGRVKWRVGGTYAVQPGRGLPTARVKDGRVWMYAPRFALAGGPSFDFPLEEWHKRTADWQPLRIRITNIRREHLQDISNDDAYEEGVICPGCGNTGWMLLRPNNPWSGPSEHPCDCNPVKEYAKVWGRINTRKGTRWADNPLVWVLTFEVVR